MDEFEEFERDFAHDAAVIGSDEDIGEVYAALVWAAGTFGNKVREELLKLIHDTFPLIREIDFADTAPQLESVRERYFSTEEDIAKVVDTTAEAVKLAQRWVWLYLQAHGLDQLRILVPAAFYPGIVRLWYIGKESGVRRSDGEMKVYARLPEQ